MSFDHVVSGSWDDFDARQVAQGGFGYERRQVISKRANQLQVAFLEVPPGKSPFPYHWHEGVTEVYVILSGTGSVRTPDGDVAVGAGDVIAFPPGEAGAHRMTNTSATEPLRYVDLDTAANPDIVHHVDSGKSGLLSGTGGITFFRDRDATAFYEGEADAELG